MLAIIIIAVLNSIIDFVFQFIKSISSMDKGNRHPLREIATPSRQAQLYEEQWDSWEDQTEVQVQRQTTKKRYQTTKRVQQSQQSSDTISFTSEEERRYLAAVSTHKNQQPQYDDMVITKTIFSLCRRAIADPKLMSDKELHQYKDFLKDRRNLSQQEVKLCWHLLKERIPVRYYNDRMLENTRKRRQPCKTFQPVAVPQEVVRPQGQETTPCPYDRTHQSFRYLSRQDRLEEAKRRIIQIERSRSLIKEQERKNIICQQFANLKKYKEQSDKVTKKYKFNEMLLKQLEEKKANGQECQTDIKTVKENIEQLDKQLESILVKIENNLEARLQNLQNEQQEVDQCQYPIEEKFSDRFYREKDIEHSRKQRQLPNRPQKRAKNQGKKAAPPSNGHKFYTSSEEQFRQNYFNQELQMNQPKMEAQYPSFIQCQKDTSSEILRRKDSDEQHDILFKCIKLLKESLKKMHQIYENPLECQEIAKCLKGSIQNLKSQWKQAIERIVTSSKTKLEKYRQDILSEDQNNEQIAAQERKRAMLQKMTLIQLCRLKRYQHMNLEGDECQQEIRFIKESIEGHQSELKKVLKKLENIRPDSDHQREFKRIHRALESKDQELLDYFQEDEY